jgi:glyoxylase-like metal-dependent hydrolase (beta-lactamase superfamily II)
MEVAQLAPGLWRWTARHLDWTPEQGGPDGWGPEVASYYVEVGGSIVLVDPIVSADEADRARFWRALDRDVERLGAPQVLLTCEWHARSTEDVLERYDGSRSWIGAEGAALPGGAHAIPGLVGGDVLIWLPSHAALVAGDTLLGSGAAGIRLCPDSWLGDQDPVAARASLRERLRGLEVALVLPTHGEPVLSDGSDALARALA